MKTQVTGPILLGGVGGSGTRVVAELVKRMGVSIGNNLNVANDNMTIAPYFPVMRDLLKSRRQDNASQIDSRINDIIDEIANDICEDNSAAESGAPWGWKIPVNFVFISYFRSKFPNLKYIHLIRNGLDMAFSKNQNQLHNWGDYFGIDPEKRPVEKAALDYWIQGNKLALKNGRALGSGHFMTINYEDLCDNPAPVLNTLKDFLGASDVETGELRNLIISPSTRGRFREKDLSTLTAVQLESVTALGFEIS